jgi:hypothetical protein
MKMKHNLLEYLRYNIGSTKRKIDSYEHLPNKSDKSKMNNLIMHLNRHRKSLSQRIHNKIKRESYTAMFIG